MPRKRRDDALMPADLKTLKQIDPNKVILIGTRFVSTYGEITDRDIPAVHKVHVSKYQSLLEASEQDVQTQILRLKESVISTMMKNPNQATHCTLVAQQFTDLLTSKICETANQLQEMISNEVQLTNGNIDINGLIPSDDIMKLIVELSKSSDIESHFEINLAQILMKVCESVVRAICKKVITY